MSASKKLKYIVVDESHPVIFPETLVHADVGRRFNVTSAGFCQRYPDGKWRCWGESLSLGIKSDQFDEDLLNETIG